MILACNLITLTGCASTSTLEWLRDEHADAIAEDLVIAVATRISPEESPVFLTDMPLRDHFEGAIREHGFAVSTDPDDAVTIGGVGERIPPNTWHMGLSIDGGIRIHRLYHVEQDDIHALSSISMIDVPKPDVTPPQVDASRWHLRALSPPEQTAIVAEVTPSFDSDEHYIPETPTGTFLPVIETTAPVPDTTKVSNCLSTDGAVFTFSPGSLKQTLDRALKRCGWTISTWPLDSTDPRAIVDWIVTAETRVQIDSVEDLLLGLRAIYGLESTIDHSTSQISFSLSSDA